MLSLPAGKQAGGGWRGERLKRLGIYGRSHGGVLTSASITQHPELFGAAVVERTRVDMLRYTHLSAGASWSAEYGDPDVPADCAFIARYSAYQALRRDVRYPRPTSPPTPRTTASIPAKARKFSAKLESLGRPGGCRSLVNVEAGERR